VLLRVYGQTVHLDFFIVISIACCRAHQHEAADDSSSSSSATLHVQQQQQQQIRTHKLQYDLLVGADGAGSAVRAAMTRALPGMKVGTTSGGRFC
jgi:2-polyprenyl-6-methoxyphenol hydroxylase-like FAD-dependent oxidoreductase